MTEQNTPATLSGKHKFNKGDTVYYIRNKDLQGPFRVLAEAEGYLMVRRKGCLPFVMNKSVATNGKGEFYKEAKKS